jgi:uridine phosphorylase
MLKLLQISSNNTVDLRNLHKNYNHLMKKILETDLILNKDGSVYHLNLIPDDIAETIITVGDQDRVTKISNLFDKTLLKKRNREFVTHTGELNGKLLTVLSTGIGTDNIDIVLNELDALVNIDLETYSVKENKKSLDIIRVGTSGSMQKNIEIGSNLISEYAIGLDGLLLFYDKINLPLEALLASSFKSYCDENLKLPMNFYVSKANEDLVNKFASSFQKGITITCPGFYAPQGRQLRAANPNPDYLDRLANFNFQELQATNFEMETSGIYGLGSLLGHKCVSCNVILANRITGKFAKNPEQEINNLINNVLGKIVN